MPTALQSWLRAALAALLAASCAYPDSQDAEIPPVGLIVLISVDQFPSYLLERYDTLYTGGLRRLLDEGLYYRQALHDHAITVTSAGHSTLVTGLVPARHGIVANEWWELVGGESVFVRSVHDTSEQVLGVGHRTGRSPRNLKATALPDWAMINDRDARVVTLSGKPYAAVLMGGGARGHIYWYEDDVGRFVTSSYYRDSYPDWVTRFNDRGLRRFYADSVWELVVPAAARPLARADAVEYEFDGSHTAFPHSFLGEVDEHEASDPQEFYDWWDHTPELDRATLALAKEAVDALALGQRASIDYMGLSLSQLDRVGHRFGPLSLEQLDALLRLDRDLGEFLTYLDRKVGAGRYVVGLSSDHGVLEIPTYRSQIGLPGRYISSEERRAVRDRAQEVAMASSSPAEARAAIARAVKAFDFVADVVTLEELAAAEPRDSFVALYQRSYYPDRVAGTLARHGLMVRWVEGAIASGDATTHGSAYWYDRNVPLILMGPGVPAGVSDEGVRTVDMAPTLAGLAGLYHPDGLDGRRLVGVPQP
jgi:predicted AlkP superfamily pyrophosphatase or phosphodiesterase